MTTIELNNINYLKNPYPHCVIDNFFDKTIADDIYNNLESLKLENANSSFTDKKSLHQYNKFAFNKIDDLSSSLKDVFVYLNSKEFRKEVELMIGDLQLRNSEDELDND